jgi:uncharacterized membrane protein YkvA (DUF1232 family)
VNWIPILAIVGSLLAAWALFIGLLWVLRPRDMRLGEALRIVPDLLWLVRDLIADSSTPLGARAALIGLLAWLVSPIDIVPEFIPVLGPLDDVVVAVLVLRYVRRRIGEEQMRGRWRGTPEGFDLLRSIIS